MAAFAEYALHQRRAFFNREKEVVLTARLIDWSDFGNIKVDRVKTAAGEDVSATSFKAILPASALAKLAVLPGATVVKRQFGLSSADEYGLPPGVDFRTSLAIGDRRKDRKGESCVAQSVCQMTPKPDIVGARFAVYDEGEADRKAAALRPQAGASSNLVGDTVRDDAAATKKFVAPTQVATESGGDGRGRGHVRGGGADRGSGGGGPVTVPSEAERRAPAPRVGGEASTGATSATGAGGDPLIGTFHGGVTWHRHANPQDHRPHLNPHRISDFVTHDDTAASM